MARAQPAPAVSPFDVDGYLAEQLRQAHLALAQGRRQDAQGHVDRALSVLAALENPQVGHARVAFALNDAMAMLAALGQVERAHGLLKAAGPFLRAGLSGPGAAIHRLTEATILQAAGDLDGAILAADAATAGLREAAMDPPLRTAFAAQAQSVRGVACAVLGRLDCADPGVVADPTALKARVAASGGLAGAWYRPDAADRLAARRALALALDADTAFALFQIAGRSGPAFDADALTALGQARTEAERRTIHQALRLRARRDRLERAQIQAIGTLALEAPPSSSARLTYDPGRRRVFRDFAVRLDQAATDLARGGVSLGGANLTPLKRLQASLASDEAALTVAPVEGGLAYMCVRRGRVVRANAVVDAGQMKLDGRILQQALSATHAPSEMADSQFPAEAAMRLYDILIRPFETCLRPGDRIVWLPGVATVPVPLAALLRSAPARQGEGYDLRGAEWLVTRHAVSYAGSAAALVAARSGRARDATAFDFLGVGDPILTGRTADGTARGAAMLEGVRGREIAALAPLPDTADELEASARGFGAARLLLREEATERRFRGELVSAYRYLSFATHGLIRDDLQGLSEPALVLTPVSMQDPRNDGLLTASEIADLQMKALFVALSACNTANFDLSQVAQDLPALASAFAVAGVPSTLATLWPVNSETGKTVVADTFARLKVEPRDGAALALARAQRAFLAAPPTRAHLHPRFWAPFVVLGDGGAVRATASEAPRVTSVDLLTRQGGEVLDVRRRGDDTAARFISDADDAGRHGAGVRLAGPSGELWRQDIRGLGASRFTVEFSGRLVVSGYQRSPGDRFAPTLEAFDLRTGAPLARWRGDRPGATHAFVFDGESLAPNQAVLVVGEPRAEGRGPVVELMTFDGGLTPASLARIDTPVGTELSAASITAQGGDLILTFTDARAKLAREPAAPADDWDDDACFSQAVTWIQRRDGRTGALKAERRIDGLSVATALARGKAVWLGGAQTPGCGREARAVVLTVDSELGILPLFADTTLGASDIRSLSPLPDGRVLAAASKVAVFDVRAPALPARTPDPYRLGDLPVAFSGIVFALDANGRAGPARMLDSGGGVYVSGADASRADDVLLGGALGGEGAIFHFNLSGR